MSMATWRGLRCRRESWANWATSWSTSCLYAHSSRPTQCVQVRISSAARDASTQRAGVALLQRLKKAYTRSHYIHTKPTDSPQQPTDSPQTAYKPLSCSQAPPPWQPKQRNNPLALTFHMPQLTINAATSTGTPRSLAQSARPSASSAAWPSGSLAFPPQENPPSPSLSNSISCISATRPTSSMATTCASVSTRTLASALRTDLRT
jgi:hypothetical protein